MIELLIAISLIALAGFGLTLIWEKLPAHLLPQSTNNGLRPQYMPAEPRRVARRPEMAASRAPVRSTAFIPAPASLRPAPAAPAHVPPADPAARRPLPYIPAPSYGRSPEELVRRSSSARDALARDLS